MDLFSDVLAVAGSLVGLALGMCGLLAIAGRVVVLPWIRTHLLEPVKETNRQVTVNGNRQPDDPTLKDSVHNLQKQHDDLRRDIGTAALMFEGHIHASETDRGELWRAVYAIRGDPLPAHLRPDHDPTHRRNDDNEPD